MNFGGIAIRKAPRNSSMREILRFINASMLAQYSSNVFTSGAKEVIRGWIRSIGKNTVLACRAKRSFT